jgi:hypothetical protein
MEIFMLPKTPKVYEWGGYRGGYNDDCQPFNKYDLENIPREPEPEAIFYWYVTGSYEGSGELIAVKNGKWYMKCLSHCSCYGPMENFASDISDYNKNSLDELLASGTDDWKKGYAPLVELAKSKGYK